MCEIYPFFHGNWTIRKEKIGNRMRFFTFLLQIPMPISGAKPVRCPNQSRKNRKKPLKSRWIYPYFLEGIFLLSKKICPRKKCRRRWPSCRIAKTTQIKTSWSAWMSSATTNVFRKDSAPCFFLVRFPLLDTDMPQLIKIIFTPNHRCSHFFWEGGD